MKKMMLLGLSILGMTNFANAWVKQMPQEITAGSNGYATVICYNRENGWCMTGEGASPTPGQLCVIWGPEFRRLGVGTVIKCSFSPEEGEPVDDTEPVEAEFMPE